jgi:hypothetical protein
MVKKSHLRLHMSGYVVFLILLFPMTLYSQVDQSRNPWWVHLGVGPSFIGRTFSMNAGMVYCYQLDRSVISARMLGVTNDNPTVQRIDPSETIYKMADYGILYGPMWTAGKTYLSIGAGVGLVRAAYETPISITTNTSISLPLEVQWFWRPTPFAGIGMYAYASLNLEKQLWGMLVCAQLGMW